MMTTRPSSSHRPSVGLKGLPPLSSTERKMNESAELEQQDQGRSSAIIADRPSGPTEAQSPAGVARAAATLEAAAREVEIMARGHAGHEATVLLAAVKRVRAIDLADPMEPYSDLDKWWPRSLAPVSTNPPETNTSAERVNAELLEALRSLSERALKFVGVEPHPKLGDRLDCDAEIRALCISARALIAKATGAA